MSRTPIAARAGFALPAVLLLLAVVALVFLVAIEALSSLGDQTRRAVDGVRFETRALDLQAQVAYAAAVGTLGPDSLAVDGAGRSSRAATLRLDGSPYAPAWAPDLRLGLQDEAGLINIDQLTPGGRAALVAALGARGDQQAVLADRLADFMDPDDLPRLKGAERAEYVHRDRAPPPNEPLRDVTQLEGVLGWRDMIDRDAWREMREILVADPTTAAFNVNTAPPAVMKVLFGLDDAQVRAVAARRSAAPFVGLEDFARAAGLRLSGDAERRYDLPNGRFLLTVVSPADGMRYRARIVLSADDPERPFWIEDDGVETLAVDKRGQPSSHATSFPFARPGPPDPGRPVRTR